METQEPRVKARRLSDEEAREVRVLRAANPEQPLTYFAWLFEVTDTAIHKIVTGQSHKDAGGPVTPVRDPTTEEQVIEIRNWRARGYSYREISELTGKKETALRSICSGKSFPHVGGPIVPHRTYRRS